MDIVVRSSDIVAPFNSRSSEVDCNFLDADDGAPSSHAVQRQSPSTLLRQFSVKSKLEQQQVIILIRVAMQSISLTN